ncbi:uroporphyrinogen decarboxylase [Paucihalobacter ruber]|uniref:Uroporphyrinogen decarboxylase n=1 Tax=Paucihalobacter ruber TaxID=2567861 RepID=A0A506PPC2_9FLAO|nr:uroporphyrinogen decarboxylase [Paucihalobacter ruber]TPV35554.1 uroporphyrinogen decarboxylase [Paucihalobacter ruber]
MEFLGVNITEWVGYLASFVLLLSFTMKDMRKLRMVNSAGAVLFVIYGFMLSTSWPIVITNAAIFAINMYYLSKHKS